MTIQEVIDRRFKDEETIFFQSSDRHRRIEGDAYLRYQRDGDAIQLWFGGENGDVCLCVTVDGDRLDALIKAILYA